MTFSIFNIFSIMTLGLSLLLASYVYENNKNSKVNRTFLFLIFSSMFWIFANFMTDLASDLFSILLWSKLTLIGPIGIGYFFYRMSIFFPKEKKVNKLYGVFALLGGLLLLAFVPTRFNILSVFIGENNIPAIIPGPLYFFFLLYFLTVLLLSFVNLFRGYKTLNHLERLQISYISLGVGLSALFGSITNLVLPLLGYSEFVNFGPYFILIFIFFSSYAIIKYKLFDIKILTTQLLVFSLSIFIFLRALLGDSLQEKIINGVLFVLVAVVGYFLIKSVFREVEQREKIETLAKDLEETNDRQEKLIHFIGHEVKGYLTKGEYAFSEMVEGDYGELSPDVKVLSTTALAELRKGVASVTDILKAANLKRGTVAYELKPTDLKGIVEEGIIKLKPSAEEKGLKLLTAVSEGECMVNLDRTQFGEHVIRNLIDNSIKYTPTGSVTVGLSVKDGKAIFSVKDTGVGITEEDKARLFTEGGRGKDSLKVNVHSTGYGLYIAKQLVLAHGGRIWVESEGAGKGSTFLVELPLTSSVPVSVATAPVMPPAPQA